MTVNHIVFKKVFSVISISGLSKMDQDDVIKEEQDNCNGPLNIPENETILSENEEEIDPFEPECIVQIKDDSDLDVNQENSAETVNEIHLSKHKESVHDGIKKKSKCTICDYETMNKAHLKRHIESVHERIKPFKCKLCDYETAEKRSLKILRSFRPFSAGQYL